MRIYILRHGQTDLNSEKRFQGQMQTELNEVGIAQSEKVAELLSERDIKFDKIYCSPLERAIKTAEIVTSEARDKFIIDDDLAEIDFGINEGRKYDELHGDKSNIFLSPGNYIPPEGGESLETLKFRVKRFLERVRDENSEGNLGLANAVLQFLAQKLPVSRLQRDLTDSTVLRNVGVPMAHALIAFQSTLKGLGKLILNEEKLAEDLENTWAVVAEAIQTILRREAYPNPYEALKALTRTNEKMTERTIHDFVNQLNVNEDVKKELLAVKPWNYTGV